MVFEIPMTSLVVTVVLEVRCHARERDLAPFARTSSRMRRCSMTINR